MNLNKDGSIRLTKEEAERLCKPFKGEETCIWCMLGGGGFDCHYFYRPKGLVSRWSQGRTVSKRSGCEEVKALDYEIKYVDVPWLSDLIRRQHSGTSKEVS